MSTSGSNIKEQMSIALEDSKIATSQLIEESERLKTLREDQKRDRKNIENYQQK